MAERCARAAGASRMTRRGALGAGIGLAAAGAPWPRRRSALAAPSTPIAGAGAGRDPAHVVGIVREAMAAHDLRSVLLRVTIDGDDVVSVALGESLAGQPATIDMRFRNGAVAIMYVSTLLLRLVDRGVVGLDDPIGEVLPDLPDADRVTYRMLANMTAGYPDYVQNQDFVDALYADPFRQWQPSELIAFGLATPRVFAPGENWDYSHTDYVILGQALEVVGGGSLADQLRAEVLDPLGLADTRSIDNAEIPGPVLHAFTAERRAALGIPAGVRFLEDSTYWNPSWTLPRGAIQVSTVGDMATSIAAVGRGTLLSPDSHRAQVEPRLLGFGQPLAGCPNCHTLDAVYSYGLGIVLKGSWLLQNPSFAGCAAVAGYLPSQRIAIALATTFEEDAFDEQGDYRHGSASQGQLFDAIGAYLAPDEAPPA